MGIQWDDESKPKISWDDKPLSSQVPDNGYPQPPTSDFSGDQPDLSNFKTSSPVTSQDMIDFLIGATGSMRGTANLIPSQDGERPWGERLWPSDISTNSGYKTLGKFADPIPWMVGGGISKILPYAPMLGGGFVNGVKSLAKNVGAGALTGGTIGLLSDEGKMLPSATAGAAISAVFPPMLSAAYKIGNAAMNIAMPYTKAGLDIVTGRILNNAAGNKANQVMGKLESYPFGPNGERLTASEASIGTGSTGIPALQEAVKKMLPDEYTALNESQNAARTSVIAPASESELIAQRKQITDPLREVAINNANIFGQVAPKIVEGLKQKFTSASSALQNRWQLLTEATKQENLANNFYPVPGLPRVSSSISNQAERVGEYASGANDFAVVEAQRKAEQSFLQYQLDSLETHGLKPLSIDSIVNGINNQLSNPAFAASNKAPILSAIRDKISAFAKDGVIDANSLYTIRKEINETIQSLLSKENPNVSNEMIASVATKIKPMIDSAIDKAAGGGWNKYITTYEDLSKKIDQSRILQYLSNKLESPVEGVSQRATVFNNAIREAPQTIKKATGFGGYDNLEQVLTPQQLSSVKAVENSLNIKREAASLASAGSERIGKQINTAKEPITIPNFLSRPIMVFHAVMDRLQSGAGEKSLQNVAEVMQDPVKTAQLMRLASQNEREQLLRLRSYLNTLPKAEAVLINGTK